MATENEVDGGTGQATALLEHYFGQSLGPDASGGDRLSEIRRAVRCIIDQAVSEAVSEVSRKITAAGTAFE